MDDDTAPDDAEESEGPHRLLIGGGLLLGLLAAAAGGLYLKSEQIFKRNYEAPLPVIKVPVGDSQAIAEGERLGVVRGCVGCHTATLNGKVAFDTEQYRLSSAN